MASLEPSRFVLSMFFAFLVLSISSPNTAMAANMQESVPRVSTRSYNSDLKWSVAAFRSHLLKMRRLRSRIDGPPSPVGNVEQSPNHGK